LEFSVPAVLEKRVSAMRNVLIGVMVLAMAAFASAGNNPDVYAYISFDAAGDEGVTTATPAGYTTVSAYVCLGNVPGGMTTISFLLKNVTAGCPGVMATQAFVPLLPGGLTIGDAFVSPGITCASTECMYDTVIVGRIDCFYLGGDCCFEILDHADYPRWVVDCQEPGQVDTYCLKWHGIVGAGVCGTETEWPCDSPVDDSTWGNIKAMYR
jgi:hypothetical protein